MTRDELVALLNVHNIPFHTWGKGTAKTLDHLLQEVNAGETELVEENNSLTKYSIIVAIDVYYRAGDVAVKLIEDRQVFADGRTRTRSKLYGSLVEKVKLGEAWLVAAYRALREELTIEERIPVTLMSTFEDKTPGSMSYPGLRTRHFVSHCKVSLPVHLYKPEGYVEKQADKTTYFVWVNV